jgi:DNA-binding NarL/FixJ family response regulator
MIAQGLPNAVIAEHLVVAEVAVMTHVNRLFAKTGVRDRAQIVAFAYKVGLVTP